MRGAGWGDAGERLLAGDASFRKYFRLSRPRESAVVMDAPPPQEDVRPFVRIGRHLIDLGLSAPEILAEDTEHGFLLLEDFGDDTYARVLEAGGDESELYCRATDVLVRLYQAGESRRSAGTRRLCGRCPDRGGDAAAGMVPARRHRQADAAGRDRPLSRRVAELPRSRCRPRPTRCCCATTTRTISSGCRPGPA